MNRETLLLTRQEIRSVMRFEDYLEAVETAFRLYGEGKIESPPVLDIAGHQGTFHVKAAAMDLTKRFAAVKINGNFPGNAGRFGLPTIQGVIALFDGENGSPLALMDSIEITVERTAAATALAARHLARPDSEVATICGCGAQAKAQLRALDHALALKEAYAFDVDERRSRIFAETMSREGRLPVRAESNLGEAARKSDVIVTCTTSRQPFLEDADVRPGAFVAAVGADAHDKRELHADLLRRAKLVVDVLEQCATIGELHHALEEGVIGRHEVHAELGEIVAGRKPGRIDPEERIVFDSTGSAIQDVASAIVVYERAREKGIGYRSELSE